MKEKILLADDEERLSVPIATILNLNNYEVDIVSNGKEAVEKTRKNIYDVILLDIMMPIMDGIEALKEIRKNNINTPVILLTAKSEIEDKVKGLDAGANDYLTKPFDKEELLARIRVLTRKNEMIEYVYGNIKFNVENSEISTPKASLFLNSNESEIMKMLIKNQETNISRDDIEKVIKPNTNNDNDLISMYMSFLQEKFKILGADIRINDKNGYNLEKLI